MALLAALLLPGCVTRTLTIESEPPGALVVLDGEHVGFTPYSETFLSYGVRRLELRHPGHVRLVTELDVWRPWWQYFPISMVAELLWPFPVHDQRRFAFELATLSAEPQGRLAAEEVYERLRDFRPYLSPRPADERAP